MKCPDDEISCLLEMKLLKSRTFWTLVGLVVIGVVPIFRNTIPQPYYDAIVVALGILASYFRLNPSQKFGE